MTREEALRVLGVGVDASSDVIRRAQRKILLKVHPDRNASASESEKLHLLQLSQEVNAAVDVLLSGTTWEADEPSYGSEYSGEGLGPELILASLLEARNFDWKFVLDCARELAPFPQFAYESNVYRAEAMLYLSLFEDAIRAAHEAHRLRSLEHLPLFILAAGYSKIGNVRLALNYVEEAIHKATPIPERYLTLRAAMLSSQPAQPDSSPRFHRSYGPRSPTRPVYTSVSGTPVYSRPQQPSPLLAPIRAYIERPPSMELGVILSFLAGGLMVIGAELAMFGRGGWGICLALTCLIVPLLCREVFSEQLVRRKATIARTIILAILTGIGLSVGVTAIATGRTALGLVLVAVGVGLFLSAFVYAIRGRSLGEDQLD